MNGFWLETFGWIGSVLVVISLTLANARRFRWFNLIGCLVATAYNAALMIWPYTAMNLAISAINIYWLLRLRREAATARDYTVLEVEPDDALVRHLLDRHADRVVPVHGQVPQPARQAGGGGHGEGAVRGVGRGRALVALSGDQPAGVTVVRPGLDGAVTEVQLRLPGHEDLVLDLRPSPRNDQPAMVPNRAPRP